VPEARLEFLPDFHDSRFGKLQLLLFVIGLDERREVLCEVSQAAREFLLMALQMIYLVINDLNTPVNGGCHASQLLQRTLDRTEVGLSDRCDFGHTYSWS
jgi:hypothetical protein